MRRGKSSKNARDKVVVRAWLAAHSDARSAGAEIPLAQLAADAAAARAGAWWTAVRRAKQLREALRQLRAAGARAPERTAAAECSPPRELRGYRSRKALRQLDAGVQRRRAAIGARDRARARGLELWHAPAQLELQLQERRPALELEVRLQRWVDRMKAVPRKPAPGELTNDTQRQTGSYELAGDTIAAGAIQSPTA